MSIKSLVKQVLVAKQNNRYEKLLSDKTVTYECWRKEQEQNGWEPGSSEPGGERCSRELAQGKAAGDFVVLCAGEGRMAEGAVENIRRYLMDNSQVQLLYGDEDALCNPENAGNGTAQKCIPWFKPDWSPDLLEENFYFGSLVGLSRKLYEKALEGYEGMELRPEKSGSHAGSVSEEDCAEVQVLRVLDLRQYADFVRSCVKLAGGYEKGCGTIGHFPGILYHGASDEAWKFFRESRPDVVAGEEMSVERCRGMEPGTVGEDRGHGMEEWESGISVIIPSRDNPEILEKCIAGCLKMEVPAPEIIVVDNGSSAENRKRVEEILKNAESVPVQYIYQPMEFNFSKMCNLGAEASRGRFLLFLNDDVELCQPDCLRKMAAKARRSYVGAVGLKLYYPDSVRIQHAGITNLPMGPVHKLQFKEDNMRYYFGMNCDTRNVLAVTAACLMVEKEKYLEAGGFTEELRVAFNDVDFCFGLYELGYQNVCVNDSYAYHHESLSRGADESREKLERLIAERAKLYARHPELEGVDPYYSRHLNRVGLDTSIRPSFECGRNQVQAAEALQADFKIEEYRQDECLLFRVEDGRQGRITGYGVVLGDNNACYEKKLVLKRLENMEGSDGRTEGCKNSELYALSLSESYRPDLAENMPDQVNVALAGFDVEIPVGAVPGGSYLPGMAVRNRVTGLKLYNFSNRVVEL